MRKLLFPLILLGAAAATSTGASASEHGCKVLLCLANPASKGGPKGVAECVPSIDQLFHDLRQGRPFPTCDLADGNQGASYARLVFDPYDPCPAPLQPAAPGAYVVQGQRKVATGNPQRQAHNGEYSLKGRPLASERPSDSGESPGARACVGKLIGRVAMGSYDDSITVGVFDRLVWQAAQNPRGIDVFVDNAWLQRVRW